MSVTKQSLQYYVCQLANPFWLLAIVCILLPVFVLHPEFDLIASRPFFDYALAASAIEGEGFWMRNAIPNVVIHEGCLILARTAGVLLLGVAYYFWKTKRHWHWLTARGALFLVLALIIGPGLVTNSIAKDHWGRARPFQIEEFGGKLDYTPALFMADQCPSNCSFFSGDGALGFTLHAPFYLVSRRWRRRAFWLGWGGGGLVLGGNRLIMGAHFLSDILFAGIAMLLVIAGLHAVMYGWRTTRDRWRELFSDDYCGPVCDQTSMRETATA